MSVLRMYVSQFIISMFTYFLKDRKKKIEFAGDEVLFYNLNLKKKNEIVLG